MPLILFASPKGGVGKTTLAAHTASILAKRGHSVLALDFDPQNALHLHLGQSLKDEAGYIAQLGPEGLPPWRDCVQQTGFGVKLLPFGAADPRRALEIGNALFASPELLGGPMRDMLAEPGLVVVADAPPGPSACLAAALPLADLPLIVLLADGGSASLLPLVASGRVFGRGVMSARAAERMAVLLNQVELDSPLGAAVLERAAQLLGARLLGAVCRDDAVAEALADRRLLLDGQGAAAEDLQLMADRIAGRLQLPPPVPVAQQRRTGFSALRDWGLG